MNETARELAHVVLPSACAFEKDGTFMNAERRVQRVRKAVDAARRGAAGLGAAVRRRARDGARPAASSSTSAEQIWDEIRAVWPAGRGITYARLERGGLQWPCPDEDHPGTTRLHVEAFASGQRASLRCIEHVPSPEQTSPDYPFVLVTGRRSISSTPAP